ncbi:hypothetical protein D187_009746 [Cystobacter fuscus DSM 2262]|uniref:Uncharacterized protein n=1 Tax=Cystobacter fuscus (strain ATCC 25194 / DSM 2262 / NBRC 100088 / M29) TaxID=1242864 RepID=S9NYB3_CYSF2|nr:hypothetical protein [Cystobacter fuscus]EPX55007.1 hypothetical protein D187_009746 [Cystobacter fuscus DSM 2262]
MHAAESLLQSASPHELRRAEQAYRAYGCPTAGRSAITGVELPGFESCPPLVRAGWLSVVRTFTQWGAPLLRPDSDEHAEDEGQVDPFLMGLGGIAAATKDLAEASRMAVTSPHNAVLGELISTITGALHARVKELALPASS